MALKIFSYLASLVVSNPVLCIGVLLAFLPLFSSFSPLVVPVLGSAS